MNTMFLVSMIVELIFAVGFIFAPGFLMAPMGVTLGANATMFARMFGSALISFPILLWFTRKSASTEFRKAVVTSLFVYYLVSGILLLIARLTGMMNPMGWSVVILHVVLTIWFGYYLVK